MSDAERELNERLIERTSAMLNRQAELTLALNQATSLIRRCRDASGRMEMSLYEDLQNFLHKHQ